MSDPLDEEFNAFLQEVDALSIGHNKATGADGGNGIKDKSQSKGSTIVSCANDTDLTKSAVTDREEKKLIRKQKETVIKNASANQRAWAKFTKLETYLNLNLVVQWMMLAGQKSHSKFRVVSPSPRKRIGARLNQAVVHQMRQLVNEMRRLNYLQAQLQLTTAVVTIHCNFSVRAGHLLLIQALSSMITGPRHSN